MVPDRVIARRLMEYDPCLFLTWNNQKQYFEVWREMPHGRRLITPVTKSIYEEKAKREYVELDERLLWWIYDADSWASPDPSKTGLLWDTRWQEFQKKKDLNFRKDFYAKAKSAWGSVNHFYTTKHESKNAKPSGVSKPTQKWLPPDNAKSTSSRLFARSRQNALQYNYRKPR